MGWWPSRDDRQKGESEYLEDDGVGDMEKVYWITGANSLNALNSELAKHGGHVSSVTMVRDDSAGAYAVIVVEYKSGSHPNPKS